MKQTVARFLLATVIVLPGCTQVAQLTVINRTELTVVNHSTAELTNVVSTGSGFTQAFRSIPPGEQRSVSVNPRGESSLQLAFDAGGKHFSAPSQGYFESSPGYKVTAIVSPTFSVTVDTKL